jgi:hypothetical protein
MRLATEPWSVVPIELRPSRPPDSGIFGTALRQVGPRSYRHVADQRRSVGVGADVRVVGDAALCHDQNAVAQAEKFRELARTDQQRRPLRGSFAEQRVHLSLGCDVNSSRRLGPYEEVLDAWRTSCPRFPVWEETNDRGYVERQHASGGGRFVSVSEAGTEYVRTHRPHTLR